MKNYPVSTLKKRFLLGITYCTVFSYINVHAQTAEVEDYELERPKNYLETIAKQYLGSFIDKEIKIEKTEEEKKKEKKKKRKNYEMARPNLSERDVMSILLLKVLKGNNKAVEEFLQERLKTDAVDMRPMAWETMHILQGSTNAPEKHILGACLRPGALSIEKAALALMLVTPTTDIEALKKSQEATAALLQNRALYTRLKGLYGQLQEGLPAVISLYDEDLDPMWSINYQKLLKALCPCTKDGKFYKSWGHHITVWFLFLGGIFGTLFSIYLLVNKVKFCYELATHIIEATKMTIEHKVPFSNEVVIETVEVAELQKKIPLAAWEVINRLILAVLTPFIIYAMHIMLSCINKDICGRITDVKTLLEVAQEISNAISSDPKLEALYGDKLRHTRKLLALQHENPAYNKTVEMILNNNFKDRGIYLNRISTLLYVMSLLKENIHMLDEVLFELGHLGTYLSIADLVENPDNNQNSFSFAKYLGEEEKPEIYIDFKNNWSISVDPNKAVPNDIFMDGASYNTAAIMGPNACGKSIIFIRAVFESALLAQTLGIIPGKGSLTPFSAIYVFKEPKDDPSINKSLFARELDMVKQHKKILQYYQKLNKKTLTIYDEFLNSTNPLEGSALQCILIVDIMQTFPKNGSFVSTHNPYLIDVLDSFDKSRMYHVKIKRFADNSYKPLYKVGVGTTKERVGIDLYEKETGDTKLAEKARKLAKQIEKSQGKINAAKQVAASA